MLSKSRTEAVLPRLDLNSGTGIDSLFGEQTAEGKHCSVQALDMNVCSSLDEYLPMFLCPGIIQDVLMGGWARRL